MKKHIPNIITLLNLLSGVIAVMFAANNDLVTAAIFVCIGIFFDFFDGLVARLLNVQSELGLQLDSLADVVTSGVVPGIVMFQLMLSSINENSFQSSFFEKITTVENTETMIWVGFKFQPIQLLPFIGLLLTLAAAYRLAKFNLDERQTSSFIGLPTPAMALFVLSLPVILAYSNNDVAINLISNPYFLIAVTLIFSFLMNAEIPLFSLKFKNFTLKNNFIEILFLIISIILTVFLKTIAIPLIIISYVVLSAVKVVASKK
ncbi:CDP-alcohol phosphatidyltransferase family protein [Aureibaculum sp. 2210JD6-5]|uniref:CDP-alcohol phosphatidyltransferase family protein n=1 Tax=Aureibaculum sp. 2210JD6-5 TaxID=3103957 RepID=UPI002AAD02C5|nr:CDP-alcohol phosphatidyltransferase family protein [Aureibaculum sp. 2210JD6-5]MDY7395539.1 CDP-alcohol phosphatidyltransferase family protein [Aureibaculum sp. 2210JD6-5]